MSRHDSLLYYGYCKTCNSYFGTLADVTIEDIKQDKCPSCGNKLIFQFAAHRHPIRHKGITKYFKIAALVISAMIAFITVFVYLRINKEYTMEEVSYVKEKMDGMTTSDILNAFCERGINETTLASLLNCSRFSVIRLRQEQTIPTESVKYAIEALYTGYLLLGQSNLLFLIRNLFYKIDPYYYGINPLQEQFIQIEEG